MARHARKRTRRRRATRVRRTQPSYRHGLKDAIGQWLPGQYFSRWPVVRGCRWTAQRVFWMALLMSWSAEQTLIERFQASRDVLRSLFPKWSLGTTYTGWYQAQLPWLAELTAAFARRLRQQMQRVARRYWQRQGWCAFAADGSRLECPRTKANEDALGCAGRKKTGPQLYLTMLWHFGTGLPWDFRIGQGTASERQHVQDMLTTLPPGSLVVADGGFTGYDLYQGILAAGHHFLLRVGANVHLLSQLGFWEHEGANTVYLWPQDQRQQPPVTLRLIRLRQGKQTVYLVTDVLDRQALTQAQAGLLYEMRWGVEVFYRSLKQTLEKRKLLSRTPLAAQCELTWAVLSLWILGLVSVAKILARGADPLRWSVASARQRVRQSMRVAVSRQHQDRALAKDLGKALQDEYRRRASKQARNWPSKKKEKPPGAPKIKVATAKQRRAAQRVKAKNTAA